jgi:hypothetical protein
MRSVRPSRSRRGISPAIAATTLLNHGATTCHTGSSQATGHRLGGPLDAIPTAAARFLTRSLRRRTRFSRERSTAHSHRWGRQGNRALPPVGTSRKPRNPTGVDVKETAQSHRWGRQGKGRARLRSDSLRLITSMSVPRYGRLYWRAPARTDAAARRSAGVLLWTATAAECPLWTVITGRQEIPLAEVVGQTERAGLARFRFDDVPLTDLTILPEAGKGSVSAGSSSIAQDRQGYRQSPADQSPRRATPCPMQIL